MSPATFIIYFCSSRVDNLLQTLRYLQRREPILSRCEVLLMCQDEVDSVDTPVQHQLINLKLPEFNKAVMANKGVMLAQSDKIVLLDGDRLLPANYFTKMKWGLALNYSNIGGFKLTVGSSKSFL
jgi:hypothetical protein